MDSQPKAVSIENLVALLGGLTLFVAGVGGFIVQAVNARNSAKKSDLDNYIAKSNQHAAEDKNEFAHLVSEIARLEQSLDRRRKEYEQLWEEVQQLRQENISLRAENTRLKERVAELEKLTAPKTKTGPLGALPATGD
jgi:septal ring factor EnvC (AmiA/AmiB activator)